MPPSKDDLLKLYPEIPAERIHESTEQAWEDSPAEKPKPYRCPQCGSECLDVQIVTWAGLQQYRPDREWQIETDATEAQDGSHEWNGQSPMICRGCGHLGNAGTFRSDTEAQE